ncbi:hypothetical protein CS0771_57230 [Catellatospora sp. IY07-71]|nr:hypothetical protein CS0771_57230 [Catellatospora sp. IY07-71]
MYTSRRGVASPTDGGHSLGASREGCLGITVRERRVDVKEQPKRGSMHVRRFAPDSLVTVRGGDQPLLEDTKGTYTKEDHYGSLARHHRQAN